MSDRNEQNNISAILGLAYRYDKVKDYAKAFEWFMKAAEQGDIHAQFQVGSRYDNGKGVEENYEKAFEWYMKAAKQGYSYAQFAVGSMYVNGDGVEKNYEKAKEWLSYAAKQGIKDAQELNSQLPKLLTGYSTKMEAKGGGHINILRVILL